MPTTQEPTTLEATTTEAATTAATTTAKPLGPGLASGLVGGPGFTINIVPEAPAENNMMGVLRGDSDRATLGGQRYSLAAYATVSDDDEEDDEDDEILDEKPFVSVREEVVDASAERVVAAVVEDDDDEDVEEEVAVAGDSRGYKKPSKNSYKKNSNKKKGSNKNNYNKAQYTKVGFKLFLINFEKFHFRNFVRLFRCT